MNIIACREEYLERLDVVREIFQAFCRAKELGLEKMQDSRDSGLLWYWDALEQIRSPIMLVAGANDEKFTTIAWEMAARIPGAEVEIVPEAGHNVVLERPDTVRALLERVVSKGGAP